MPNNLEVSGLSAEQVYVTLQNAGVSASDAAVMVSGWIYESLGRARRTFDYHQAFPETIAACAANFNRTFVHQDWVDGESVVQAQQSAGEDGFNVRFHRIETDLDAIRADIVHTYACMAEMRASLRHLLDELRAEINRLNNDVYQLRNAGEAAGTASIGPLVKNPKFLGVTKMAEKAVSLWDTEQGTFVLPIPQTLNIDPVTDQRVRVTSTLSRWVLENPAVQQSFPNGFTRNDLVGRFGRDRTRDGTPVADLLTILPPSTRYPNVTAMVDDLADRQAAALRTTEGANQAVMDAFGLDSGVQKVDTAPIEKLKSVPADARAALSRGGMDTVGRLAGAQPQEIARLLESGGLSGYSAGDVAEWTGAAKVLTRVL